MFYTEWKEWLFFVKDAAAIIVGEFTPQRVLLPIFNFRLLGVHNKEAYLLYIATSMLCSSLFFNCLLKLHLMDFSQGQPVTLTGFMSGLFLKYNRMLVTCCMFRQ